MQNAASIAVQVERQEALSKQPRIGIETISTIRNWHWQGTSRLPSSPVYRGLQAEWWRAIG
eukprot:scaffold579358_cov20-Prasinocladus_malaysianus.AAC.1